MKDKQIIVFYKWTAKPGKLDELKNIYNEVRKAMEENEPDALKMDCYFADEENAIIVYDLFKDGEALGFHFLQSPLFPRIYLIIQLKRAETLMNRRMLYSGV